MLNFRVPNFLRYTLGNPQGFTLLETMIAMGIMIVSFSSILAVQSGSINASNRAKQMNIVAMLAKNQILEAELRLQGKKFEEAEKEKSGTFQEPYTLYRWKTEVKEIEFPKLNFSGMNATKDKNSGGADSGPEGQSQTEMVELLAKLMTNYLSKSIREITVTISWTKGSGEQSFSVTDYWVDLNHEFQMSE